MIEDSWHLTQLSQMILPRWVSAKHGQHYWDARSILGKTTRKRLPFFQSDTLNRKGKIQLPCASKYKQLPVKTVDLFTEIYIQGPSKTLPIELGTMLWAFVKGSGPDPTSHTQIGSWLPASLGCWPQRPQNMVECVMNCRFLKNEFIKNYVKNELPYTLDSAMPWLWPFLTMKTTGSLVGSCDRLISADIGTLNKSMFRYTIFEWSKYVPSRFKWFLHP